VVSQARIVYRVRQFCQTLCAPLRQADVAYAAEHLSPGLLRLFQKMTQAEQQHGITLSRALEAQGHTAPDLLAAALLHDVGKTRYPPRLWERVLVVLGEHFAPRRAAAWGVGTPRGLRRGFVIRQQHATWGADLAEGAGASPRVVALIRQHHDVPAGDRELAALQAADEG